MHTNRKDNIFMPKLTLYIFCFAVFFILYVLLLLISRGLLRGMSSQCFFNVPPALGFIDYSFKVVIFPPMRVKCCQQVLENDRNGGIWQSGILKPLAEYVQCTVFRLCMKMSSFLFVRVWTMPRMLYLSRGIPFPV